MLKSRLKTLLFPLYMLFWLTLSVYLGEHHKPFADEAQGWLIARDTTLSELFLSVLRKEGHPFLWYLWLKFLMCFGLPYSKIYLASLIPQAIGVALFLKKAPFPLWARLAFVSTYFIFYQYNIVARSYSLIFLFIVLTALWTPKRNEHPLIYTLVLIGLGSISVHTFILSAGLFALFMLKQKDKAPKALFATFMVLTIAYLFPDMQRNNYIKHFSENKFIAAVHAISLFSSGLITAGMVYDEDIVQICFSILYFILLMIELIDFDRKKFIILLLPNLVFMAIVSYKLWHTGIIILIIMLILWQNYAKKISKTLLSCIVLFFIVQTYWSVIAFVQEQNGAYSSAPAVHDFLKQKNIPIENTLFLTFNTISLCPYDEIKSCTYWNWEKNWFMKKTDLSNLSPAIKAVATNYRHKKVNEKLKPQGFVLQKFPSEHFFASYDMSSDEAIYLFYKETGNE